MGTRRRVVGGWRQWGSIGAAPEPILYVDEVGNIAGFPTNDADATPFELEWMGGRGRAPAAKIAMPEGLEEKVVEFDRTKGYRLGVGAIVR